MLGVTSQSGLNQNRHGDWTVSPGLSSLGFFYTWERKEKIMPRTKKVKPANNTKNLSLTEEIIVQYNGGQWDVAALKEAAISAYVAQGHQRGRIRKLALYIKPHERKVYYVVNEKIAGRVDLD